MSAGLSRFFTLREQVLLGGVAAAILIGAGVIYATGRESDFDAIVISETDTPQLHTVDEPVEVIHDDPITLVAPSENPEPAIIGVAVRGAIERPGLYYFSPDQRVDDLIKVAGGYSESADDSDINIGARLIDGTTLSIPEIAQPQVINPPEYTISRWRAGDGYSSAVGPHSSSAPVGNLVNLNTATQAELESLPGIGPSFAARIMDYRANQPFERIEDLLFISGIAEKRFAAIRDFVTVR